MYHVVHLILFFLPERKGLLNSVSERMKLVYRINLVGTAFKNNWAAFQTSKTTIYRPHTPELKSISKFQLLFHHFYSLPWSRWNRIYKLYCEIRPLYRHATIAKLGQKTLEAASTLRQEPLNSFIAVHSNF